MKQAILITVISVLAFGLGGCSFLIGSFDECSKNADCDKGKICKEKMCISGCLADGDCSDKGWKFACRKNKCTEDVYGRYCQTVVGDSTSAASEIFPFGAIMTMTNGDGSQSPRGEYRSKALGLGLSEVNQVGIAGKHMRVRICDHQGENSRVRDLTQALIDQDNVLGMITGGSADTVEVSGVTIPAERLLMAISASSPAITTLNDNDLVWRIASSDKDLGVYVAGLIGSDPGQRKDVAIMHVNDTYGSGLASIFGDAYREAPINGTSEAISFEPDGSNLSSKLDFLATRSPDLIYIIAFSDQAAQIVNWLEGQTTLPRAENLFFADSMKDSAFLGAVTNDSLIENSRGASPGQPEGPVYDGFASRFTQEYALDPTDQGYLAHSYDAAYSIALATAWAVKTAEDAGTDVTGPYLAEGLKHISNTAATSYEFEPADFSSMISDLQNHTDINITGASGALDFDPATGEAPSAIELWWIYSGQFQTDPPAGTDAGVQDASGSADAWTADAGQEDSGTGPEDAGAEG